MDATARRDNENTLWRTLGWSLGMLLVLVVAHDVDHLITEDAVGGLSAAFWIFLPFQYVAFGLTLALVLRRDPRAPALAALLAALSVLAFVGAHVMPFGPLPYADYDLPAASWVLVFVPTAEALFCLLVALRLRAETRAAGQAPRASAA